MNSKNCGAGANCCSQLASCVGQFMGPIPFWHAIWLAIKCLQASNIKMNKWKNYSHFIYLLLCGNNTRLFHLFTRYFGNCNCCCCIFFLLFLFFVLFFYDYAALAPKLNWAEISICGQRLPLQRCSGF